MQKHEYDKILSLIDKYKKYLPDFDFDKYITRIDKEKRFEADLDKYLNGVSQKYSQGDYDGDVRSGTGEWIGFEYGISDGYGYYYGEWANDKPNGKQMYKVFRVLRMYMKELLLMDCGMEPLQKRFTIRIRKFLLYIISILMDICNLYVEMMLQES